VPERFTPFEVCQKCSTTEVPIAAASQEN